MNVERQSQKFECGYVERVLGRKASVGWRTGKFESDVSAPMRCGGLDVCCVYGSKCGEMISGCLRNRTPALLTGRFGGRKLVRDGDWSQETKQA
jgi:hypothetical protein